MNTNVIICVVAVTAARTSCLYFSNFEFCHLYQIMWNDVQIFTFELDIDAVQLMCAHQFSNKKKIIPRRRKKWICHWKNIYLEHVCVSIFFVFHDNRLISWQCVWYWVLICIQNSLWCLRWLNYIMSRSSNTIRFGSFKQYKFRTSSAFVPLWQKSIISAINKKKWIILDVRSQSNTSPSSKRERREKEKKHAWIQ